MQNKLLASRDFWRIPSIWEDWNEAIPNNNLNGLSVSEDEENVYIEAAVPGIDAKDVEVTFENGVLTVKAEKKEEEKGKKFYRKATSRFHYQVAPGDIDVMADPKANYKNGVMKVTFQKQAKKKAKRIPITTG